MMALVINLPTDLLRTFITVVDLASYTKAGNILGRTQPAISLQIRRLEELLNTKLIETHGRVPALTSKGETLSIYARQILSLNDEAAASFRRKTKAKVLRVGLPTDYAVSFLQNVLAKFTTNHPHTRFEVRCDLGQNLLNSLRDDELDIAIAMTRESVSQYLARAWVERPIWVVAKDSLIYKEKPVPLVVHPNGCEYRNRMIEALGSEQRSSRFAYTSPGISSLQNAIMAGFGVSALTQRTLTEGLRVLGEEDGFPALKSIRVGLYYKHPRQSDEGLLLINYLISQLDQAGEVDFRRLDYK